jgi:DNA polymerase-3 subunit epsilon
MREIVFDTETTGFDPAEGHRMVEIACVELVNLMPTGREYHAYFNPERDMPDEAFAVHGLSVEFLADKPLFADSIEPLLEFFDGAQLVAHNAEFDMRFIQAELKRCARPSLVCPVVDTLAIARRRYPGAGASLDALCRRFGIDLSERTKHGALIDTRLLAKVYLELMGGVQPGLALAQGAAEAAAAAAAAAARIFRPARIFVPSEAELAAHEALLGTMKEPLWRQA